MTTLNSLIRTPMVRRRRRPLSLTLTYLALVFIAAASMLPFLWMVATWFKHGPDVYPSVPRPLPLDHRTGRWAATLDNYRYVLDVGGIGRAFVNSVVICGILVPAKLLIDALAGYAFARI